MLADAVGIEMQSVNNNGQEYRSARARLGKKLSGPDYGM